MEPIRRLLFPILYRLPIHIWLIGITSTIIIGYAASVLIYVWQLPEIGISASFQEIVSTIDKSFVHEADHEKIANVIGQRIEKVAGEQIDSWPQWSRAIHDLDQLTYPTSETPPRDSATFQDATGTRWVYLQTSDVTTSAGLWCRVSRIPPGQFLPSILWIVLETGLFVVGAVIFWKRPRDLGARLFYVQLVVAIGAYMGGYHWARICTQPLLTSVYIICAVLLPPVHLHFFLAFPSPKLFFRRRPYLTLTCVYLIPVVFLATILSGYMAVRWLSQSGSSPDQVNLSLIWLRNVIFGYFGVAIAWYVASIAALVHSYVTAKEIIVREQLRWIVIGSLLALVPFGYALYLANWRSAELSGGAAIWPMFAASICFTFSFAIGITRYRLLQFDQMLGSGMAYVFVSFLAGVIYCAMVVVAMLVFGGQGPSLEQAAWVSGSVLVLTIVLDVARTRLRNYLDRRFRKDKTQLDQILQKFGEAVEQLVDTPTMARRLLQMTTELYGYPQGAIYLQHGNDYELATALGIGAAPPIIPGDSALVACIREKITAERLALSPVDPIRRDLARTRGDVAVALSHENRLMGILILARAPGQAPRPSDSKRLAAFAPMAALALAGAEVRQAVATLNSELQSKVEKISEQQRRIFSLQQQLIAQSRRVPQEPNANASTGADKKEPPAIATIVGSSSALQQVLDLVPRVAANNSAVLIRGESGTGKELVAKALHDLSARAKGPFVKVHCAALAPGVLESELFGHVKGAFTGALRDKPGRFEAAHEGTLFLDEIGDINPDVQTKLLRVLQEKMLERVGSNETIRVDVRLVTATHQDLDRLIRNGKFRADLFYRLNVITLNMPPLRDRAEDVLELAQHFLRIQAGRCDKAIDAIDDEALLALRDYAWPGNIRELENTIERAVVIAQGSTITLADLPPEVLSGKVRAQMPAENDPMAYAHKPVNAVGLARQARHSRERIEIVQALEAVGWNRTEAARQLGLARSTLISRMKKFGLLDGPLDG